MATANTYVSQADATLYFEKSLYAAAWTAATSGNKDIALAMATRLIDDYFRFDGRAISSTQALKFPRYDIYNSSGYLIQAATLPQALKDATAEMAQWLISSDRTAEADDMGFAKLKVGNLELVPDANDRAGVIPSVVIQMLAAFARPVSGGQAKVRR